MKIIFSEKFPRILKNKRQLEKSLNVKISNRGKEIILEGGGEEEYIAGQVVDALNFGFPLTAALQIAEEESIFEIINIKDHTKRKDYPTIRARIIGKEGGTLKTLSSLTNCNFELKGNEVGIIGPSEEIKNAQDAIVALIQGSKQSNIYAFLEKSHPQPIIDLGLKTKKKR